MNAPALILPTAPARKARRPRVSPPVPGQRAPSRDRSPEAFPPPVLDALAADEEWLALCVERHDDAVEHQDSDPDAEWADLPQWMHLPVGGVALGIGEVVDGQLVWRPWPVGRA